MEWWGWLITAAAGIATILSAVKAIRDFLKPALAISSRVDALEKHEKSDLVRFERQDKTNQALLKGVVALMDHAATGNSIENLKKARKEMTNFIIEN